MSYLTLAVKKELSIIANKICVCLEPDSGISYDNYNAFSTICIGVENSANENTYIAVPNKEYVVYGAEIKDWLLESVMEWKNNPELLHTSIKDIYLNRWNVETDLTLQDCIDFCNDVLLSTNYGVMSGILDMNLILKD